MCVGVSLEFPCGSSRVRDDDEAGFWRLRVEAFCGNKECMCLCIVLHDDEAEASGR